MNGRYFSKMAGGVLLALLSFRPLPAQAFDSMTELTTPFQDPLLTAPVVSKSGVVLSGDGRALGCPAVKDFESPLLLIEAVDLALCNNSRIKAAWAAIKVQAATVGTARAAYLPTLSGSASRREDKTRYPGSGLESRTIDTSPLNGAANWRLFDFGGRGANLEAANQALAAALATHDAVLQKTLAAVIQAYFDAQVTRAAWGAKEKNEVIAQSTLDTARRREARGAGATGETLQAATALARTTLEKNRALGSFRKALSVLIYEIGVEPSTRVILADDLEEPPRLAADGLDRWLQVARKHHPALAAARAELEAAQYRVTTTRSEGLPSIDFTANYYENGRLDQSATLSRSQESVVGITLTFPIFDGFSRTYKVRGAEAQVEQKGVELQDSERQILMEVVKAHADARSAVDNLEASGQLLTVAQEALNSSKRKYEKGAADILEILNTQTALADARQERIRSLAEWRSARLRLLASAGSLGREDVHP